MTTRYVGIGGNDGNTGLSWAQRKLTLNGVEDTPIEAGDTVYVGAGTYRETLTCDVSGSSGSPISYIGDYTGANTDGTGGAVRITASNDDKVTARNMCVIMAGKAYRTFTGFVFYGQANNTYGTFWIQTANVDHLTISKCYFNLTGDYGIKCYQTAKATNLLVENCIVTNGLSLYTDQAVADNSGNVFQNILFYSMHGNCIDTKSGGITVKNCSCFGTSRFVFVSSTLNSGQTVTVNNCYMSGVANYALAANTLGNLVEDYNFCPSRSNVTAGANSVYYLPLADDRWASELLNGGSMITPFDLASYSQIIDMAGTSPTTADMRGTTVQGAQREWGALEYDSTLDIEAGTGTGGGAVSIQPIQSAVRL